MGNFWEKTKRKKSFAGKFSEEMRKKFLVDNFSREKGQKIWGEEEETNFLGNRKTIRKIFHPKNGDLCNLLYLYLCKAL